jgi:hypothetical protein
MMRLSCATGLLVLVLLWTTTASAFHDTARPPPFLHKTQRYSGASSSSSSSSGAVVMATTTAHDDGTATKLHVSRDDNLALLSKRGRNAIQLLQQDEAQQHVLANWPPPGTQDDGKIRLTQQVRMNIYICVCVYINELVVLVHKQQVVRYDCQ